jgi:radical SAM protein, TIGR01212 family
MNWNGKPYHSLDYSVREQFGEKLYKLALDGGMSCPNRDGTIGYGGCIFCSEGGSGDFAQKRLTSVTRQIEDAKKRLEHKFTGRYIAYFQSYTNTYAPVSYLEPLFMEAISHPDIAVLSIATRPDCLPEDVLELLSRLNQIKPVWIELGLQTIHPQTAGLIRRGYPLSCFETAYQNLKKRGISVIVHVILGLPGETKEIMRSTISYLADRSPVLDGIKLQLLHILKGTSLAAMYQEHPFPIFSMEDYIDFVIDCVELLPPEIVIHRITGDGPKSLLIAPMWSANKKLVLNTLTRRFKERASYQGKALPDR